MVFERAFIFANIGSSCRDRVLASSKPRLFEARGLEAWPRSDIRRLGAPEISVARS